MCDSRVASGRTSDVLTQRCQFLLSQGLAPSTLSAQCRYIDFYRQDGRLNSDDSFLPADEETLMRFALGRQLNPRIHKSILVCSTFSSH